MLDTKLFLPNGPLNTAVLFLVFNRLDTTKQVFEAIKKAAPPRLYIASDGDRKHVLDEDKKVRLIRDFLLNNINWDCEVKTLFREENLGCKYAVSGAIDWFFENEEMGIILEDDCLPSQSFFWYCEELLIKYKENTNINLISGNGMGALFHPINEDYTFIKYPLIWGWASWRRVWKNYDVMIKTWPQNKLKILRSISDINQTKRYWKHSFDAVYNNKIDTWDFQFVYLLALQEAKCIIPKINLIKNIGFGVDATHSSNLNDKNANVENYELNFPLSHPKIINPNHKIGNYYDINVYYSTNTLVKRVFNKLRRMLNIN